MTASNFAEGATDPKPTKNKAAKTLLESGLLFEINRSVLHPFGMALVVEQDDAGNWVLSQQLMATDDPEGILFTPDAYREGHEKLCKFMNEVGTERLNKRLEGIRCVVQCWPEHGHGDEPEPDPELDKKADELRRKLMEGGGMCSSDDEVKNGNTPDNSR